MGLENYQSGDLFCRRFERNEGVYYIVSQLRLIEGNNEQFSIHPYLLYDRKHGTLHDASYREPSKILQDSIQDFHPLNLNIGGFDKPLIEAVEIKKTLNEL
jgi:hypothetical protein